MAAHPDTELFGNRNYFAQKVDLVLSQLIGVNLTVEAQLLAQRR